MVTVRDSNQAESGESGVREEEEATITEAEENIEEEETVANTEAEVEEVVDAAVTATRTAKTRMASSLQVSASKLVPAAVVVASTEAEVEVKIAVVVDREAVMNVHRRMRRSPLSMHLRRIVTD